MPLLVTGLAIALWIASYADNAPLWTWLVSNVTRLGLTTPAGGAVALTAGWVFSRLSLDR